MLIAEVVWRRSDGRLQQDGWEPPRATMQEAPEHHHDWVAIGSKRIYWYEALGEESELVVEVADPAEGGAPRRFGGLAAFARVPLSAPRADALMSARLGGRP